MVCMMLVIFVALMVGVLAFFKISDCLKLKNNVEIIAFGFLFYNKEVLRCGYSPFQTDMFALVVGICLFYFFLKKQKKFMMCIAFLGAFIWQSIWPIACVLLALPWDSYNVTQERRLITIGEKGTEVVKGLFIIIPILSLAYLIKICLKYDVPISDYGEVVPYFWSETSILGLVLSTITLMGYISYLLYPIHFDIFTAIKHLWKSIKFLEIVSAILLFVLMNLLIHFLANKSIDNPSSLIFTIRRIMWEPLTFPMKFLETHLLTFGLVIIFFLIYYKRIIGIAQKHSLGYLFCIIYIVVFGSQTETRFIINMLPFMVFAIANVMNEFNFRKWVAPVLVVSQLILSHFWFHINTSEILMTKITEDDLTYLKYPLQRMFEFTGPWQSINNYYKWISIFAMILVVFYIFHKKKWLYIENISMQKDE